MTPGDITIDPEFQNFIRPLSADERKELKESISSAGLLMPLILWRKDGKNILVDGHNRLSLWKEFDGFNEEWEFKTQELHFGNREDVKEWIIKNQLGRRNLSPTDFNLLLGQLYNQQKKARGGDRKSKDQIDTLNTAEKLAADHGVSAAKVKRAGRLAAKVEEIQQAEPELPREEVIKKAKDESKATIAWQEQTFIEEENEYNEFLDSPFGKAAQEIGKIAQGVPMPTAKNLSHANFFVEYVRFELVGLEWDMERNRLVKERKRQERAKFKATTRGAA